MKTSKLFIGLCLLFIAATMVSCAGKKINLGEASKVEKGPLSIWASWVKDKGKKWDALIHIGNEGDKDLVIVMDDISCWRGSAQGDMKYSIYVGDRILQIRSGRKATMTVVCNTKVNAVGPYIVAVKRAYENPTGDGITQGKVLVNDLEWRVNALK